jgi:hypothetical protein
METWKDLPFASNLYMVSDTGKILSKNYNRTNKPKLLTNVVDSNGYLIVSLFYNKKAHVHKVHRLVCQTFLNNDNNYPIVNHKNGIKTDNNVNNLEWCTHKHNVNHSWENNLRTFTKKDKNRLLSANQKIVLNTSSGIFFDSIKIAADSVNHNYIKLIYKLKNRIHNDTNFILI